MVRLRQPNLSNVRRLVSSMKAPSPQVRRVGAGTQSLTPKNIKDLTESMFQTKGLVSPEAFIDKEDEMSQQQQRLETLQRRLRESNLDVPDSIHQGRRGFVGGLLNALGAPSGAFTTLLHDAVDGGEFSPLQSIRKGFTGEDRKIGSDVLAELGVKNKVGKALGGFALDVALDPLSYLGVGIARNVGTAATRGLAREALGESGERLTRKQLDDIIERSVGASSRGAQTTIDSRVRDVAQAFGRPVETVKAGDRGVSAFQLSDVAPNLPRQFGMEVGIPFTNVRGTFGNLNPMVNSITGSAGRLASSGIPVISHLGKAAQSASDFTKKAFGTFGKLPNSVANVFRQRSMNINFGSKQAIQTGIKISNMLGKTFRDNYDVHRGLAYALENPDTMRRFMAQVPKESQNEIRQAFRLARDELEGIAKEEVKHGILAQDRVRNFYFPHMVTGDETAKAMAYRQLQGVEGSRLRTSGTYQQERTMDTLAELENFVNRFNTENPNLGDIAVDFNIGKVIATRKIASETLIQNKKFLDNLKEMGPNVVRRMESVTDIPPAGFTPVSEISPELANYAFADEVATFIAEWNKISMDPTELGKFTRLYDTFLNGFKTLATATPGFHIRNFLGSMWNNWIMGVREPTDYLRAGDLILRGNIRTLNPNMDVLRNMNINLPSGQSMNGVEILEQAQRYDILNVGWMGDLRSRTLDEIGNQSFKRKLGRLGHVREFGETTEDIARLAGFMNQLQKHGDSYTAALNVKKHLFDYSELSKFEKTFMRRIVPFYTWSRKNIPLQLEALITRPGMFTGLAHAQDEGAAFSDIDIDEMPEWVANSAMIPFGRNREGHVNYLNQFALPANDLFEVLRAPNTGIQGVGEYLMRQTAPSVKGWAEIPMNRQFFSGQPIDGVADSTGDGLSGRGIMNYLFQQSGLPYNLYRSATGETELLKPPGQEPRPDDAFTARNLPPFRGAGMLGMLGEYNPEYWTEHSHPYRYGEQLQGEIQRQTIEGNDVYTKAELDQAEQTGISVEQVRIIRNLLDDLGESKSKKNIERYYYNIQ